MLGEIASTTRASVPNTRVKAPPKPSAPRRTPHTLLSSARNVAPLGGVSVTFPQTRRAKPRGQKQQVQVARQGLGPSGAECETVQVTTRGAHTSPNVPCKNTLEQPCGGAFCPGDLWENGGLQALC